MDIQVDEQSQPPKKQKFYQILYVQVIFAIIADGLAAAPTIKKAYLHPNSESWQAYTLNTLGFFVGILAIQKWDFTNYAFVLYLFVVNGVIALLAAKKPKQNVEVLPK